ncbi:MAG: helix-turn-helix transcriptional regulator [Lactococcus raffinolactis]|jgi:transcriptional regulator with XRE-family HTH domain
MVDLETLLIPQISERCKTLRESYGFTMENLSDKSAVSRIEKGITPKSGNFITDTVLSDYVTAFNKTPEEIIFGNKSELNEVLEDIFNHLLVVVTYQELAPHLKQSKLYINIDQAQCDFQKATLPLAEIFAEFNLQRYNFLKTNDKFMDDVNKAYDKQVVIDGEVVNPERDFRPEPINEKTVIDYDDMFFKIWLIIKEKFTRSFQAEILDQVFEDFKYASLNTRVNQWLNQQVIKVIIPDVLSKLKTNSIFKIGRLVKYLIDEFLDEDLSESFQTTVPLKTTRPRIITMRVGNRNMVDKDKKFTKKELDKMEEMQKKGDMLVRSGKIPNAEELSEYAKYGITFRETPETVITKEVEIDSILNRASQSKHNGTTKNHVPMFEEPLILEVPNDISKDTIDDIFDKWYEDTHFNHQEIPGYFTNNSQIVQGLQENLNEGILDSIENFIHIQNNLLKLLSEDELMAFAK